MREAKLTGNIQIFRKFPDILSPLYGKLWRAYGELSKKYSQIIQQK